MVRLAIVFGSCDSSRLAPELLHRSFWQPLFDESQVRIPFQRLKCAIEHSADFYEFSGILVAVRCFVHARRWLCFTPLFDDVTVGQGQSRLIYKLLLHGVLISSSFLRLHGDAGRRAGGTSSDQI